MQLELTNFFQYTKRTFVFPDVGAVLLKGVSGAGKSTILKAIDYAINGTAIKKSWHGGLPAVILDWGAINLKITRTGTQTSSLIVLTEAGEFRDDAAQAEIYRKLCGSKERFNVSSYIRQRMKGALINLGPAEQLRLIQSLAFGDDNPEATKAKIAATLKTKNEAVLVEDRALADKKQQVELLQIRLAGLAGADAEPPMPCEPTVMESAPVRFKEVLEARNKLQTDLGDIARQLANPLYEAVAGHAKVREQLNTQMEQIKTRLTELHEAVRQSKVAEGELGPEPGSNAALDVKTRYLDDLDRAKALVAKAKAQYPEFKEGPLGLFLKSDIEKTKAQHKELHDRFMQLHLEYQEVAKTEDGQPCPECGASLSVTSGKIHKHVGVSDKAARLETLKGKLDSLVKPIEDFKNRISDLTALQNQSLSIKKDLGVDPDPTLSNREQVQAQRDRIIQYAATKQKLATQLAGLEDEIARVNRNIESISRQIDAAESALRAVSQLPSQEELRAKSAEINSGIETLNKEITVLSGLIEKIDSYRSSMERVSRAKAVIAEIECQITGAQQRVLEQEKLLEGKRSEVGAWTRIRELSDIAAVQAVEDTITDINNNAQAYLSRLFPDDGTVVRLLNTSKNQKGDEKAKLSLEIIHKGFEAGKNDEDLSGGEQDRIALSFQLAMSDLYASPILMVDEGFAGADVEKTLPIGLGVLKDYSASKLVFVIQHGAPEEFFDEVLEIG